MTRLLSRFREVAPPTYSMSLLELPRCADTYAALTDQVADTVSGVFGCVLIAESFRR